MKFTGRKCSHNDPSLNRESLAGSLRSRTCRPLLSATHPTPYDGLDSVHGRSPVLAVSKSVPWFSFPPDIRAPLVALLPPIAPIRRSVRRTRVFLSTSADTSFKAVLFYDWLLCLDQEIARVWKAGGVFNAASLVYGLSRFPLMLGMIFTTATIFPLSAPVSGKLCPSSRIAIDAFIEVSLVTTPYAHFSASS